MYNLSTNLILEKIKVKVGSFKVTKNKSHEHVSQRMFSG